MDTVKYAYKHYETEKQFNYIKKFMLAYHHCSYWCISFKNSFVESCIL